MEAEGTEISLIKRNNVEIGRKGLRQNFGKGSHLGYGRKRNLWRKPMKKQ